MHSTNALFSLLAITACVLAAPLPPVARNAPNLHEVIRNPAPIDAGLNLSAELAELLGINVDIHTRDSSSVQTEASPPVVVD
jgi:hypothetical protein